MQAPDASEPQSPKAAVLPVSPAAEPAPSQGGALHLVSGRTMRQALLTAHGTFGRKSVVVDHVTAGGKVTLVVSTRIPRSTEALKEMRAEAGAMLETLPAPSPGPKSSGASTSGTVEARPKAPSQRSPLADVERRLREHGASRSLRDTILEGIVQRGEEGHPLDLAALEVGTAFDVASLPLTRGETAVVALVGQTGVGKTTTLAKLALRLARAGRRVALVTLDSKRVGAAGQLKAFGDLLSIPSSVLDDPQRLVAELTARPGRFDVVLVDGTGALNEDVDALLALGDQIDASGAKIRLETLVVLPATASGATLEMVTANAARIGPVGAVVTKLDEADQTLPVLEHAKGAGLGIAFLTNGPEMAPHFFRASPERFADLALIGRIG